jgi:hypothetical protein
MKRHLYTVIVALSLAACGGGGGGSSPSVNTASAPPPPRADLLYGYRDMALGDYERLSKETRHQANFVWLTGANEGVWLGQVQIPSGQEWEFWASLGLHHARLNDMKVVLELPAWIHEAGGVQRYVNWLTMFRYPGGDTDPRVNFLQITAVALPIPPGMPRENVELTALAVRLATSLGLPMEVGQPVRGVPLVAVYGQETGGFPGVESFDWVGYRDTSVQFHNSVYDEFRRYVKPSQRILLVMKDVMDAPESFYTKADDDDQVVGIVAVPWEHVKVTSRVPRYCAVGQKSTGKTGAC